MELELLISPPSLYALCRTEFQTKSAIFALNMENVACLFCKMKVWYIEAGRYHSLHYLMSWRNTEGERNKEFYIFQQYSDQNVCPFLLLLKSLVELFHLIHWKKDQALNS